MGRGRRLLGEQQISASGLLLLGRLMRSAGIVLFVLGCLVTGISVSFEVLHPLACLSGTAVALGLVQFLAAKRFRSVPKWHSYKRVQSLFAGVANDPEFQLFAGLDNREFSTLVKDLSTAAYRYSSVQGGYAGRHEGQIVLGLSPLHLRPACAAHELFHLARDVVYRSRDGKEGTPLEADTGILREEWFVWGQTLSYAPVGGTFEIVLVLMVLFVLPAGGLYALLRYSCWQ